MDQKKIGTFLKELRKEKGITQEELAEHLNVSNRSVSRWETGSNMPDISLLTDIADFYDVDVREIIEGERKNNMNEELREVADKMADYAHNEKSRLLRVIQVISIIGVIVSVVSIVLQMKGYTKPENISLERTFSALASLVLLVIMSILTLYVTGILRKLVKNKVAMTVISVLTVVALAYGLIRIFIVYIVMGMLALMIYSAPIKVYDDAADYNNYIHNPEYGGQYEACRGEMFDIFPDEIDSSKAEEFKFVYYNPWDAQYITYLTMDYEENEYKEEIERLESLGIEEYKGYYSVTNEPAGYDIVAMNSDSYYGFVYAMVPEEESGEITYVGIRFCNYFLDLDIHDYVPDAYLLEGFDATTNNQYRKEQLKDNPAYNELLNELNN